MEMCESYDTNLKPLEVNVKSKIDIQVGSLDYDEVSLFERTEIFYDQSLLEIDIKEESLEYVEKSLSKEMGKFYDQSLSENDIKEESLEYEEKSLSEETENFYNQSLLEIDIKEEFLEYDMESLSEEIKFFYVRSLSENDIKEKSFEYEENFLSEEMGKFYDPSVNISQAFDMSNSKPWKTLHKKSLKDEDDKNNEQRVKDNIHEINSLLTQDNLFREIKESKFPRVVLKKINTERNQNNESNHIVPAMKERTGSIRISIWAQKSYSSFNNSKLVKQATRHEINKKPREYIVVKDVEIESNINLNKKFECSLCNYKTNLRGSFNKHFHIHSNTKLFKCFECDYECDIKYNFKRHLLTHCDRKLFKCSECDYECNQKVQLKKHLLGHSKTKFFKCSECDYKCNRKDYLKRHLLTHSNIPPE